MNKSILIILVLLALAFAEEGLHDNPILIGGYAPFNQNDLQEMNEIVDLARSEYLKQNGGNLGDLVSVERQVVAGFNYKLLFESDQGSVEIIVFDQSWTHTREVTSITQKQAKQ